MLTTALISKILGRLSQGQSTGTALSEAVGVSQSSISRALRQLADDGRVLKVGARRDARYSLRRSIESIGSDWPLRRVDRTGEIHEIGTVFALAADQYYVDVYPGAVDAGFAYKGFTTGIPYWLQDQRPGGFLGRAVPARYPELQLPDRVIDWTDDHYLRYLTQRGSDTVSDIILGNPAFNEYLAGIRHRPIIQTDRRREHYPELARQVMAGGLPGSSAHGEHPKFAAVIDTPIGERPVIVKFSPPRGTAVGQRWSDLLVAEHQAHEVLRAAGIPACESALHDFEGRTYLELIRFDREGGVGRIGVTSLLAIDTSYYGRLDSWIAAATRLSRDGRIDPRTLEQVRLVETFAVLIANTDRHFGNIAFFESYTGHYQLAPIYDMLPMLFAPDHDQIVARVFSPPDPASDTLSVWPRARDLAEGYWLDLAGSEQVSGEFRALCNECLHTLEAFPRVGAHAAPSRRMVI